MKVLIVEDEKLSRERLAQQIKQYNAKIEIIGQTDSIEETVSFLRQTTPDLIFLDIQLADGLSFEIFKQVEFRKPVIFTTAYDHYALKAFELNSIDYLVKPISNQKLHQALDKYHQLRGALNQGISGELAASLLKQKSFKERFLVRIGRKLTYKNVEDAAYFFAEGKVVYLVERGSGKKFLVDHTLEELISQLLDPSMYFRINRTFIISIQSISEVQPFTQQRLLVKIDQEQLHDLIVSRDKCGEFKAWLNY